ncbi:hypothetical protein QR98_0019810 [Sarcoptes scabiei]|uniref:Uncharacterized protein n=1 Tax=Sarcoptes scabiei TaxID=52283 RepID=A0A131ZXG7_SARSC|nr:hypothetical protein QR98_0019810 [Sarcoptes scabiei]
MKIFRVLNFDCTIHSLHSDLALDFDLEDFDAEDDDTNEEACEDEGEEDFDEAFETTLLTNLGSTALGRLRSFRPSSSVSISIAFDPFEVCLILFACSLVT